MRKGVIFLCLFWMGFIFYMSSASGEISHKESAKIVNIINNAGTTFQTNNNDNTLDSNGIKKQQIKENELDNLLRKNAHAFMYMVLALLVSSSFFIYGKGGKNAIVYIMFLCLFYAVTDEFHQSFVPGRTSLVSDILVDFAGTVIGIIGFYIVYYKIYIRSKSKPLF